MYLCLYLHIYVFFVIYFCLTNQCKSQWLKAKYLLFHIVSVSQEFRSRLPGYFQLWYQPRYWPKLQSSENLMRAGGCTSKVVHSPGWEAGPDVGRRTQLLAAWTSPQDFLSVFMTWRLSFPRVSEQREQSRNGNVFYDLSLEVTQVHSCCLLLVT